MNKTLALCVASVVVGSPLLAQSGEPTPPTPPQNAGSASTPTAEEITAGAPRGEEEGFTLKVPGLKSLEIGGEYRLRYENRINFDFDKDVSDSFDFFVQRVRLHFNLQFTDTFSGRIEFQDVRIWGEELSTTNLNAPGFDMLQGWVQLAEFPGISGTGRLGRQRLKYGDERLIGYLDWLSQGRAFDGYRHRWTEEGSFNIEAFAAQTRELAFAQPPVRAGDLIFAGVYTTFDIAEDGIIDGYLLYRNNNETLAGGNEHRGTLGARWAQKFGGLAVEAEGATQFGERNGADIPFGKTYAVAANAAYTFEGDLAPWVKIIFDAASGDDPNTADNERFNNLSPTAHKHWGMMDFALWENLLLFSAEVGIKPNEKSKLSLTWLNHNTMEVTDAYFGPTNVLSAGAPPGSSKNMGNEFDLFYNTFFDTEPFKTYLGGGYGLFLPGQGVEDANGGFDDPAHFVYVQGGVKF